MNWLQKQFAIWFLRLNPPPPPEVQLVLLQAGPVREQSIAVEVFEMGKFKLTDSQEVTGLQVGGETVKGNPAPLDGPAVWKSSDENVATIGVDEQGVATIKARGLGTAIVSVSADARLGDEVKEVFGNIEIEVVPGEAAVLKISGGTIQEQPQE